VGVIVLRLMFMVDCSSKNTNIMVLRIQKNISVQADVFLQMSPARPQFIIHP